MKHKTMAAMAALGLAAGLVSAAPAGAVTFATFNPVGPGSNISLSGLTLSSNAAVTFDYLSAALAPLGDLPAQLQLTAIETGAIAQGPVVIGSFDGAFSLIYTGATRTAGAYTVHTGDDLLSGTFLGSVFTGYGSAGSLIDSVLAGGLVSFTSNKFVTFDGLGDSGLALAMTSITPTVNVTLGALTPFSAVSQGGFAADGVANGGGGGVPEPATWALMLTGFGLAGAAIRRRAKPVNSIG